LIGTVQSVARPSVIVGPRTSSFIGARFGCRTVNRIGWVSIGERLLYAPMRRAKVWAPVVIWAAVILLASGDLFSAAHSGDILHALLGRDIPGLIHIGLRKLAHLSAYGILGALAFRAARVDLPRPFLAAVLISLVVAAGDETHQSLISSRTGSPWDVGLDAVGACVGAVFYRRRHHSSDDS
jgi:hypothetical protein